MAEYKYRALGWKDDDIASLNVVDGAAANNQVKLQITKQGAGTIDGPAIVGKDGITISKVADSEKIEISGSGCVQHSKTKDYIRAYVVDNTGWDTTMIIRAAGDNSENTLMQRKPDGSGEIVMPETPIDLSITNKKYVDDNYVKKDTSVANQQVYGHSETGVPQMFYVTTGNSNPDWLCKYQVATSGANKPSGSGRLITQDPTQPYQAANKHYVDEADKDLRLKFTNLEQALNGYILDTTKEAYADLDSAVLKNSVAVGDNVYPIADKTRALVTRIEGKTTKMVQLLDKSTFPATTTNTGITFTNNGDGSITVDGTATETTNLLIGNVALEANHKYLLKDEAGQSRQIYQSWVKEPNGIIFLQTTSDNKYTIATCSADESVTVFIRVEKYTTVNNVKFYLQLCDLTAMNREDITSAEQFKAEFPEFYPYENGNIYPAKISGVKFTGKNLYNPSTPKYSGVSSAVLNGDEIVVSQTRADRYISANFELTNAKFLIGKKISISAKVKTSDNNRGLIRVLWMREGACVNVSGMDIISKSETGETERNLSGSGIVLAPSDDAVKLCLLLYSNADENLSGGKTYTATYSDIQVEISDAPTAYEPYTEPVSVTLPETYDLHGIGDYKDYLEITKNEDNELYTLKKVQVIDKHIFDGTESWGSYGSSDFTNLAYGTASLGSKFTNWQSRASLMNLFNRIVLSNDAEGYAHGDTSADLYIRLPNIATAADMKAHVLSMYEAGTPYIFYGAIATPVETVIATNLTYEQVTAIRHNGGLIEVEGNTNKGYARPTVTNTIVYRLTAANTVEG